MDTRYQYGGKLIKKRGGYEISIWREVKETWWIRDINVAES